MSTLTTESIAPAEAPSTTTDAPSPLNPAKFVFFQQELRRQQRFFGGLIAGFIAALVAGLVWATITAVTGFQIGWMAVGVGFVVGVAVQSFGRGVTPLYRFLGAGLSLFGCLAGNLMTVAMVFSRAEPAISFFEVMLILITTPTAALEALRLTFSPLDLLFYGIAIYQGYKLSLRRITQAEMDSLMM